MVSKVTIKARVFSTGSGLLAPCRMGYDASAKIVVSQATY